MAQSGSEFSFLTGCRLAPSPLSLSSSVSYHPVRMYAGHVRNSFEHTDVCAFYNRKPVPTEHPVYVMENEGSEKEKKDGEPRRGENRGERLRIACVVRGLHTYTGCPARTYYVFFFIAKNSDSLQN